LLAPLDRRAPREHRGLPDFPGPRDHLALRVRLALLGPQPVRFCGLLTQTASRSATSLARLKLKPPPSCSCVSTDTYSRLLSCAVPCRAIRESSSSCLTAPALDTWSARSVMRRGHDQCCRISRW